MMRMPLSSLLVSGFLLTRGTSSPLPTSTADEQYNRSKRSLFGDGPLQAWEIALLLLGALLGIMILGFLGGICEVMLHGKIKESNAEADAKVEGGGSRAIVDGADGEKAERGVAEGPDGVINDGRYSWQPERMSTGLSDDSTLAGSDPGAAQQGADETSRDQAQTSDQYVAWNGDSQPYPSPSRFVIDDVDSPGYGGVDANAHQEYAGHLNPPPAMPRDATYQHQSAEDQYWNEGFDESPNAGPSHHTDGNIASDGYQGEQMAAPGGYSGEGYSPAVMPDEVDYLAEYRQSQLYLQQDDDWYTAASASYAAPAGTAK